MKKNYLKLLLGLLCLLPLAGVRAQIYTQGDITATATQSMGHDSTMCSSTSTPVSYTIVIQNSFVGDSVKIVDINNATLLFAAGNTMGNNPWTVTSPVPIYNPVISDDQAMAGYVHFFGPTIKIVCGTDTINNINNMYDLAVPNPCTYGNVSGKVYIDNNGDCTYNAGDVALNAIEVNSTANLNSPSVSTANAYGYSDVAGAYNMTVQQSWMTDYTVSIPANYQFIFPITPCFPGSYTFNTLPQATVDFPLQCSNNTDVQCYAGSPGFARPNEPFYMQPYVSNMGCDSASGTLTFVKDSRVSYNAALSYNPAMTVNGDTLIWSYTNLTNLTNNAYWNSFLSSIHLTPDNTVNIGDTLCFRIYSNVPGNDINAANNDYSICLPVVNSYDPNMKEVSPRGTGPQGNIPASTGTLTYTIHFQNTGNATAYNVSVIDTLDADVNPSTLKILGASHTMSPQWLAPGVVKFNFYNINLPDSAADEAASHGYVRFNVNLDNNLAIGTQIKNKGYIYFDTNPAIITNTALNTIAAAANTTLVTAGSSDVKFYPNPASDHIFVENLQDGKISILSMNGAVILNRDITNNKTMVDISKLPNGIYMLKAVSKDKTTVRRFIKH